MHRRNSSLQTSPPSSPLHAYHPSSPTPPPPPPPPPLPGALGDKVTYSNAPGRVGKLNQIVQVFPLHRQSMLTLELLPQGCTGNYPVEDHGDANLPTRHQ